jgi:hypothetical protein
MILSNVTRDTTVHEIMDDSVALSVILVTPSSSKSDLACTKWCYSGSTRVSDYAAAQLVFASGGIHSGPKIEASRDRFTRRILFYQSPEIGLLACSSG